MKKYLLTLALAAALFGCGDKGTTDVSKAKASDSSSTETPVVAEGRYENGDELYVYARSGMVLRAAPDQKSEKVGSLAMGDKVKVVDTEGFQHAFSTKEPCGLEIEGFWVKVNVGGKEGYIFDGYLLSIPLKTDDFWEDAYARVSKVKSTSKEPPKQENGPEYWDYKRVEFEDGVIVTSEGYEGGANSSYILPKSKYSFQDAYLVAQTLLYMDPKNPTTCKCDAAKSTLDCMDKDEMSATTITLDENGNFKIKDSVAD